MVCAALRDDVMRISNQSVIQLYLSQGMVLEDALSYQVVGIAAELFTHVGMPPEL